MQSTSNNIKTTPHWEPLEALIGEGCAAYMYIAGFQQEDGKVVHAYKHVDTRNYVNLSDDGREWIYTSEGYREVQCPQ